MNVTVFMLVEKKESYMSLVMDAMFLLIRKEQQSEKLKTKIYSLWSAYTEKPLFDVLCNWHFYTVATLLR